MRTIIPSGARLLPEQAKRVFKGQIHDVYQWEQELYDGSTATFEMLGRPDTIVVIAIKDDKIVLVNEEQPSMGPAAYGLPGGRHDVASETECEAAQREVLEETGMTFATWRLIKVWQPHKKIDWFIYMFVASGFISQAAQHLDPGEKIEVELVSLDRAREIAATGQSRDLPLELLSQVKTVTQLTQLPEYQPQP